MNEAEEHKTQVQISEVLQEYSLTNVNETQEEEMESTAGLHLHTLHRLKEYVCSCFLSF